MAYDSFEIKYIWELYPDTDFTEYLVSPQEIQETHVEYDSQATSRKWEHLFDSISTQRLIQSHRKRRYEVKIFTGRNIDVGKLQVGYTTLTTASNETFIIYDVEINFSKVNNSLDYIVEISFYRYDDNYINHLSSDNCLAYKTEQTEDVNELEFKVVKPSFTVYGAIYDNFGNNYFDIPITDELDMLSVNDKFYMHVHDPDFDNETYYDCYISAISSSQVTFRLYDATPVNNDACYITINQERNELPNSTNVESNPKTLTFNLYTFLKPYYTYDITGEEGNIPFDNEEDQNTVSKKVLNTKFWISEDQLYIYEQIKHALPDTIIFTDSDTNDIISQQTKDILTLVEKDSLVNLYEFDLKLRHNTKRSAFFR